MSIPWFKIQMTLNGFIIDVDPPNDNAWKREIVWEVITRVCFKTADFLESDELYIFVKCRSQSYLIPMDGVGTQNLWSEIINQGLFNAKKATDIMTTTGEIFCCPSE